MNKKVQNYTLCESTTLLHLIYIQNMFFTSHRKNLLLLNFLKIWIIKIREGHRYFLKVIEVVDIRVWVRAQARTLFSSDGKITLHIDYFPTSWLCLKYLKCNYSNINRWSPLTAGYSVELFKTSDQMSLPNGSSERILCYFGCRTDSSIGRALAIEAKWFWVRVWAWTRDLFTGKLLLARIICFKILYLCHLTSSEINILMELNLYV